MNDFKLDKNKIPSGFSTPDNYFEDFSSKMMHNLPQKEVKVINFWERNKTWLYACASVVLLLSSFWYFNTNTTENNVAFNEYLSYQDDVTLTDITQHLTLEDIEIIENDLDLFSKENETIIKENIY